MEKENAYLTRGWIGWVPLALLVLSCVAVCDRLRPWEFMWVLAIAIFIGLKWLTWWKVWTRLPHSAARTAGYLLAWPGMDAASFLDQRRVPRPAAGIWIPATARTVLGAVLIWVVARQIPASHPLLRGWVGMPGLILMLHFGSFDLLFHLWRRSGVDATRVMNFPLRSTSLTEFWGRRWNMPFRQIMHDLIFQPAARRWSPRVAGFLAFVVSGLIHDFVISFPARGGYGLPTIYFVLQGLGVIIERSALGKWAGIGCGLRGRIFMAAFTAGPALLLFHRTFVTRVVLPFMIVIHAL